MSNQDKKKNSGHSWVTEKKSRPSGFTLAKSIIKQSDSIPAQPGGETDKHIQMSANIKLRW